MSAEKTDGNDFTYVDIDPDILSVVKKNYLTAINGQFIADDARHYLKVTTFRYDLIMSDVYHNKTLVPANLMTREYFQSIKNTLTHDGIAIFNIIAKPTLSDVYSKHVDSTIRAVFSNCMAIPLKYTEKPTNIIYVFNHIFCTM